MPEHPFALHNLRVADFSQVIAGPYVGALLALFGAEVIKVETTTRASQVDMGGQILAAEVALNKLSLTLNLNRPEGRALARRLIAISDVVTENWSLGVMRKWGLDYPSLAHHRPDLVMISMQGYGHTGPAAHYRSYGPNLLAYTSMTHFWGLPETKTPIGSQSNYPDWVTGVMGALAVMAALLYRQRTGRGQFIDLAQVEATAVLLGPRYLDYLSQGRLAPPLGNQHPQAAPHGCYPCAGDDRWCVVAVLSEEQWLRFCQALGNPPWAADPRFQTALGRCRYRAELDCLVAEWTRQRPAEEVMHTLQAAGVPAGVVQNGRDAYGDPHLRERGFVVEVEHPTLGPGPWPGVPLLLSETPGAIHRHAPLPGQDNEYICGELLGMSSREIRELMDAGVLR